MVIREAFSLLDSVEVPMRDGTHLSADVWLPDGDGPRPVLLQRTPYGKEDPFIAQHIAGLNFRSALRKGYAIVVQDTRGRGSSEGDFNPFVLEQQDGVDTIAWLRRQPFCNGKIAMFGPSYVGATQVLACAGHPEGLRAISPVISTGRHGETWLYRSGAIELGFLLLWTMEPLAPPDLARRLPEMDAADAERAAALLARMHADPYEAFARLPLVDADLAALAPYAMRWLDAARADTALADREELDAIAASRTPMMISCGWNDTFVEGSIELFETARSRWGEAAEVPDRLLIGPWSHANLTDWQGDAWHGYAANAMLSDEQLDFFAAAFEERQPSTPMVRYFRTGSNSWHAAPDWPLPGVNRKDMFLTGEDLALQPEPASSDWMRTYVSDPLDPVPTTGGATFLPGLLSGRNSGPKDQKTVEERKDVLVFTSAPLEDDLEVTGLIEARLWVSSSAVSSDWTVRLCEVRAGRSVGLVDGIKRWRRPPGPPGEPCEVFVRLGHIGHLFRKGSRLRIQIASSNFPRFDRNPQSGAPSVTAAMEDFVVSQQSVHGGPARPSRIILPVVPLPFPIAN